MRARTHVLPARIAPCQLRYKGVPVRRKASVDDEIRRNTTLLSFLYIFAFELQMTLILTFRIGQGQI